MFPLPSFCLCFQFRHTAPTDALRPRPPSPINAKTSRIHQRQQPLHLGTAAASVWTQGWIYLTGPLITKSAPRSVSTKSFLTRPNLRI